MVERNPFCEFGINNGFSDGNRVDLFSMDILFLAS